jgi:type I restriction enzyme S subunit
MPDEWRHTTWGEEISLEYGKALRDYAAGIGGVRVYGTNGPVGWTSQPLAPGPGVILGRKGAYRGVHYSVNPFFVIDTAYYVVPKTDLEMRWLYYAIQHHKLGEINDGSPIPSTTRAAVYVRAVTVPPPAEQRAIAGVLGALDDKIESNRQTSRTLEKVARAIFRAWFVDFEPVKAKAAGARSFLSMPQDAFDALPTRLVESELGPMPEGWQAMALFETANYINGAAFKASDFCEKEKGLPIVKIAELKNGIGGQTQYTCRNVDAGQRIDSGDILYSWSGNPDTSLDVFLWTKGPGVLNQHIFKVVTTTPAQKRFVYYLLRHLRPQLVEIARNKQTTGLGHVTVRDMKGLMVVKAPGPLMESFNTLVAPVFDKCFSAEIESAKLAALRDYLLPKLLSAQVRLPVEERSAS